MDMFERATRQKFLFLTPTGKVNTQDLWDLTLQQLDTVAKGLHRQLKNDDDVSFVDKERKSDPRIQNMFDVVKHVIDVKLAERDAKRGETELAAQEQVLLAILADRQQTDLRNQPLDVIEGKLAELRKAKDALKAA